MTVRDLRSRTPDLDGRAGAGAPLETSGFEPPRRAFGKSCSARHQKEVLEDRARPFSSALSVRAPPRSTKRTSPFSGSFLRDFHRRRRSSFDPFQLQARRDWLRKYVNSESVDYWHKRARRRLWKRNSSTWRRHSRLRPTDLSKRFYGNRYIRLNITCILPKIANFCARFLDD